MPPPPTTEEWERHRPLISEMYARRPLKTVRAHMREVYGFHATDRMFKGRFKQWGVEKNRRLKHRDSNPDELTSPTSPPVGRQFEGDHQQHINFAPPPPRPSLYTRGRSFTPPDEPVEKDEPMSDAPSATASPEPAHEPTFTSAHPGPLTPATTFGELTPPVRHDDDNLSADQTRGEIVRLVSEILERWPDVTPGDDHVDMYRTLNTKLRYEAQLRSSLVNQQLAEGECRAVAGRIVDDMLRCFHHTVPIGVLSTMNQLTSRSTTQELVDCLVDSSKKTQTASTTTAPAAETEEAVELFGQLARRLHHLLDITNQDESQACLEDICRRLEDRVEDALGPKSTVGLYLALLLNAKKAKYDHKTDKKLRDKALAMARHVQLHYADEPRLVLDFDRFVVSYLSIVAPAEKEVLDMANSFYERAGQYHDAYVDGRDESASQHARVVYGHSCALLADCLYARDEGKDRESARGLLFQSVYCYANAPWATMANAERQMTKFRNWCEEAGDVERLEFLGSITELIEKNETRKRGEPLIAKLLT